MTFASAPERPRLRAAALSAADRSSAARDRRRGPGSRITSEPQLARSVPRQPLHRVARHRGPGRRGAPLPAAGARHLRCGAASEACAGLSHELQRGGARRRARAEPPAPRLRADGMAAGPALRRGRAARRPRPAAPGRRPARRRSIAPPFPPRWSGRSGSPGRSPPNRPSRSTASSSSAGLSSSAASSGCRRVRHRSASGGFSPLERNAVVIAVHRRSFAATARSSTSSTRSTMLAATPTRRASFGGVDRGTSALNCTGRRVMPHDFHDARTVGPRLGPWDDARRSRSR